MLWSYEMIDSMSLCGSYAGVLSWEHCNATVSVCVWQSEKHSSDREREELARELERVKDEQLKRFTAFFTVSSLCQKGLWAGHSLSSQVTLISSSPLAWRRGVVVTALVVSTKLLYVEPG